MIFGMSLIKLDTKPQGCTLSGAVVVTILEVRVAAILVLQLARNQVLQNWGNPCTVSLWESCRGGKTTHTDRHGHDTSGLFLNEV